MNVRTIDRSIRGFSLIEVVITLGLVGIVMTVIGSLNFSVSKTHQFMHLDNWLSTYKIQVERALRVDGALKNTINMNPGTMACLINHSDCAGAGGDIDLYDSNGKKFSFLSSSLNPTQGLSDRGLACNSFSQTSGTKQCPFKWIAKWQAECSGSPCLNPTVRIFAALNYSTNKPLGSLATANYFVDHKFKQQSSTEAEICTALGGVYDGSQCVRNGSFDKMCPYGQYLAGFDNSGAVICKPFPSSQCPLGEVVSAINQDGSISCAPGCMAGITAQCLPPLSSPTYGSMVQTLLDRGEVSLSQVQGGTNSGPCR